MNMKLMALVLSLFSAGSAMAAAPVTEPASDALLGLGIVILLIATWRKLRSTK
jgi:hypothetical protein